MKQHGTALWTLFIVAALALGLLALIGLNSQSTGNFGIELNQQGEIRPTTNPAEVQLHATCYLINLQIDSQMGRKTSPEKIPSICPDWVY